LAFDLGLVWIKQSEKRFRSHSAVQLHVDEDFLAPSPDDDLMDTPAPTRIALDLHLIVTRVEVRHRQGRLAQPESIDPHIAALGLAGICAMEFSGES
jgi:hypothetical protein